MKQEYKDFKDEFNKAVFNHQGRFVLTSHMSPDPDSLASINALAYYLEKHSKIPKDRIKIYYEGAGSLWFDKYDCGYSVKFVESLPKVLTKSDLLIIVDVNSYNAISAQGVNKYAKQAFVIDHHTDSQDSFKSKLIDINKVSCVEIVYNLFYRDGSTLNTDMAEVLISGLLADSGSFGFVTPEKAGAFETAGELVSKYSVSISNVRRRFFAYEFEVFPALSDFLRNSSLSDYTKYGWGVVGYTYHDDLTVPSKIQHASWRIFAAQFLSNIHGINWGYGFRERLDSYDLSFRSNKGDQNVAEIAKYFGGGGHPAAAGVSFPKVKYPDLNPDKAKELVENYIKNNKPTYI